MSKDRLSQHVQVFTRWKQEVAKELSRYRQWLNSMGLNSSEIDGRLNQALRTLKLDRILLAFVGEFSRGKSEMINALLCKHYGQKLLPTRIGRTTMCPTELYYDAAVSGAYIKLLPIQTRNDGVSLASYKQQLEHWVHLTINLDDPVSMKKAFQEVAKTIQVSRHDAADLGFQVEYLEPSIEDPDKVHVPAWRHALINIDHPLLRQGLSIIDTPGLNALGSEPELTLSLLPDAHAVLFVLSAETGLTATDHMIWNEHVKEIVARRGAALYAVLNKIDMLWDEDENEQEIASHVDRLARLTAKQLGIPVDHVLPLSAKMGAKARLNADETLLGSSRLADLEDVLAHSVVTTKQRMLQQTIVNELLNMVEISREALSERLRRLEDDRRVLAAPDRNSEYERVMLTRAVQQEQQLYNRRLAVLQSARKLMENQMPVLLGAVSNQHLKEHLDKAQAAASAGVLGTGLAGAVTQFFGSLKVDLEHLKQEAETMDNLISRLYLRYAQEAQAAPMAFPRFDGSQFIKDLAELETQAAPFKSRLGNMMGAQKASNQFFSSVAREASGVYQRAGQLAERWCKEALAPIMQQTLQHRSRVQQQMEQLQRLNQQGSSREEQLASLESRIQQLREQGAVLDSIAARLQSPLSPSPEELAAAL